MSTDRPILTNRQTEFLTLIALGMRYQQIADHCYISVTTVKATLDEAKVRLDARTLAQAVAIAMNLELLEVPVVPAAA